MPTSDERREVAARMRNDGRALDAIDAPLELASLTLDDALGIDHMRSWCDVFDRLADLIYPTCHIAPDDWASEQCMGPMLSCDRCGAAFPPINDDYRYCPSCGARVVSGDGSRD